MKEWQATAERYVAFLDIMGFKDRMYRESHNDVLKFMEALSGRIKSIEKLATKRLTGQRGVVRPIFFSDSILLVSNDDSTESRVSIIAACIWLTRACLSMGVPIKGAISLGMQTSNFDKSLHFGKALIDAYLLQNEVFFYGIVFHHSAELKLPKAIEQTGGSYWVLYDTPFKKVGKIKHYVVDWSTVSELEKKVDKPNYLDIVNKLYLTVSGEPRKYVDNTVEFVRSMNPEVIVNCKGT